ncbi:MAG: hypothetical protein WDW38_011318 [Sanguina aurantia]
MVPPLLPPKPNHSHSTWHGLTLLDNLMPTLLFIVGLSASLSLSARHVHRHGRAAIALSVLTRAARLCALGLLLQSGSSTGAFPAYDLSRLRYLGVLQRIALCVLSVSAALILSQPDPLPPTNSSNSDTSDSAEESYDVSADTGNVNCSQPEPGLSAAAPAEAPAGRLAASLAAVILITYHMVIMTQPVPTWSSQLLALSPDCNMSAYLDVQVFGAAHLYAWPACRKLTPPCKHHDPEGAQLG